MIVDVRAAKILADEFAALLHDLIEAWLAGDRDGVELMQMLNEDVQNLLRLLHAGIDKVAQFQDWARPSSFELLARD